MPTTIYGGPYAHESEAILEEAKKKRPNYERLVANWNTITQGAEEIIEGLKNPVEPASGKFVTNSKISKEEAENPYIPTVTLYTTPDEKILPQDAEKDIDDPEKNVTAPVTKSDSADSKKSTEVDLDKL
jgi:hypothetical protein